MEFLTLLAKTLLFRSYVFVFLAMALGVALSLMGRTQTIIFFFSPGWWHLAASFHSRGPAFRSAGTSIPTRHADRNCT
jgi:hypothetical protein